MSTPVLATKLYIPPPPPRSKVVLRPRLFERLNAGLHTKLTLISASAGFGKTTLVSQWLAVCGRPAAWLSLDERDNDPPRFLTYLVAALQTIAPHIGEDVVAVLQSPSPPPAETLLTSLLNEIAGIPTDFLLVLDDYHMVDSRAIDHALTFLIDYLPPQMHVVLTTREDPNLPLARLRARSQLTELRVKDLRFTADEATAFLNQVMGLNLSAPDIAALETRTEGWIVGLQLAALSMQGHANTASFIHSFTGSHHFVLDYLVEEVLQRQPENVQTFLLRTSILDRLCGSQCDAVMGDTTASGQNILKTIEQANLFIIPLDNERRWYRYHHLFADLLRQRLHQSATASTVDELHTRASKWYEASGLELEAFHHAAAAHDVQRAARLLEGKGMPLHFRGAVIPVLNWLGSLSATVLDARPSLWVMYASALSMAGQSTAVEPKLQAAEAALQAVEPDAVTRNLIGHIAAIRAMEAVNHYEVDTIIAQSRRALEYLHPDNLPVRTATTWKLGYAYQIQGERAAASRAYSETITTGQQSGNRLFTIMAFIGLGNIQESDTQLLLAAQNYRHALQLLGDSPYLVACEAHLGLAQICYEWNDLEAAQQHGEQAVQLARQVENADRFVICEVFLARLKLAQGDVNGAAAILAKADQSARQHHFALRMPEIAAAQVFILLRQGNLAAAAHLVQTFDLPISQARVHLAQDNPPAALAVLEPFRRQMEAKGWADERLRAMVLQALAHHANGQQDSALHLLGETLALAAPEGFTRIFVDEGAPMVPLLSNAAAHGIGVVPDYVRKLLAAFETEARPDTGSSHAMIEPLSQRELEVLQLIAQGLSNHDISERLFLALSTVKGYNQNIFGKLQVQRRTEAVARARELGLI